ncbi:MAG: hypothetical protein K2N34_02255 [Lachnospiraceae bacterium]|nr:hypothetical protein [Lachnospiraceae bacterium]
MATKLKNLRIKKVDFVDEGANPDDHIRMIKRKDGKEQSTGENSEKNLRHWMKAMKLCTSWLSCWQTLSLRNMPMSMQTLMILHGKVQTFIRVMPRVSALVVDGHVEVWSQL